MTCIISYRTEGKIYFGADRRESHNDFPSTDRKYPKIIKLSPNIMIGFSGQAGLQNIFELTSSLFSFWAKDLSFQELTQNLCNMIGLSFSDHQLIVTDGKFVSIITKIGTLCTYNITEYDVKEDDTNPYIHEEIIPGLLVIGLGADIVRGIFMASEEKDPCLKIKQALRAVSDFYPDTVGGDLDVFSL